jgi:hypothetical protein
MSPVSTGTHHNRSSKYTRDEAGSLTGVPFQTGINAYVAFVDPERQLITNSWSTMVISSRSVGFDRTTKGGNQQDSRHDEEREDRKYLMSHGMTSMVRRSARLSTIPLRGEVVPTNQFIDAPRHAAASRRRPNRLSEQEFYPEASQHPRHSPLVMCYAPVSASAPETCSGRPQ